MHRKVISGLLLFIFSNVWHAHAQGQHSVARHWNEVLLEAIHTDFAHPTVHARNLFHTFISLYDVWLEKNAFAYAGYFFGGKVPPTVESSETPIPTAKVYPNPLPSGEMLKIVLNRPVADPGLLMEVFNAQGQRVGDYNLSSPNQRYFELNMDNLATGFYWIRLTGDQCRSSHQLFVYH